MTNSPNTTPPSPSKKSKRKNKIKKRLSRLKQSWPIYTAALFGGFTVSFMGFVVNAVQFMDILDPKLDPNTLSSEWILVKINGWGVTSYRQAEQQEGIGRFLPLLSSNLRATSDLIAMIYTDAPTGEQISGVGQEKDFSVLVNRDFKGKVPGRADDVKKRNSQTVQARLVQAQANQEPICLFVYGTRDNDKSLFFNILQFKDISEEDKEKYNNLPGYDDPNRKGKLAELKRFACET